MSNVTITPGHLLRLSCQCDLGAVRDVARAVREFLERQGLPQGELDAWELICAEAGNNAVEHASRAASQLPIEFTIELDSTAVQLRVVDHTAGFDLPDENVLPDPSSEGGRGLYLMRALSDSIVYLRGRKENCLLVRRERVAEALGMPTEGPVSLEVASLQSTLNTMTEELAASYESLSAIFRFAEDLNRSGGDTGFIERWLQELKGITGADWFILRLVEENTRRLSVAQTSHPELKLAPIEMPDFRGARAPVELQALRCSEDVWFDANTPPPLEDPLFEISSSPCGLAHPLYVGGEAVGVLAMGRHGCGHPFTAGQVNIIHTLADFLGIQVRNAQFQKASLQSKLTEREYEVAARIQKELLPKTHPRRGEWATLGFCESAQRVGGDFYDVLEVGSQGLLLAVADVMGKGLPAALFATVFRTLLRARPDLARSPGMFVDWLNENLVEELGELDMFITAQLAYVNFATRELRVAGAGHPPLLLAGRDFPGERISSGGPPLGIALNHEFEEERRILPPGARLLLYTDGVSEATDATGAQLGMEPLMRVLNASARDGAPIRRTLEEFNALHLPGAAGHTRDDRTLLLLAEECDPAQTADSTRNGQQPCLQKSS
jgi:serine phosphatase RsbU (regulator of sigma subunit)/anti-sigma regulatory factor (Ser/Thr protein kinase)